MFSAVSLYAGMIRGAVYVYDSKEAANANDSIWEPFAFAGVSAAGESVTKVSMNWTASWSAIKLMGKDGGWLFEERIGDASLLLPVPILCRLAGELVELSSPVIFGTIVNMLALLPATLALRQTFTALQKR